MGEVKDAISRDVGSWLLVSKEFKGFHLASFMRDWVITISLNPNLVMHTQSPWSPPPKGSLKMNFDRSSWGNLGPADLGAL